MVDGKDNPYRVDIPADTLFIGREPLLSELVCAVRSGRNTIRIIMGGRGMGKTSFARQLKERLQSVALAVIASGNVSTAAFELGKDLNVDFHRPDLIDALSALPAQHPKRRVVVILDEIEKIILDPDGAVFLDNLLKSYVRAEGHLGIMVLGGTEVLNLVKDSASPFARIAGAVHVLTGLERAETAQLLREPLGLEFSDDLIDALWAETAGHPWLLQMFMEEAVDRANDLSNVAQQIPAAIKKVTNSKLHEFGFRIWWDNLHDRGQDVYRRVVQQSSPLARDQWAIRLGNDPIQWLRVLSSTGLVALDDEHVIARGALFKQWVQVNFPQATEVNVVGQYHDALDQWLDTLNVDVFEHLVIRILAAWARATIEFPAAALKAHEDMRGDNQDLQVEAFFQMHAIVALLTHERVLTAEPEALSIKSQGRSDIKVRYLPDPSQRACIEFKIFGRKDTEVVKQVLEYAAPGDTFAVVISVDRLRRPLRPAYEAKCFDGAPHTQLVPSPENVTQPVLLTKHERSVDGFRPIRVWHFLLQLRNE